MGWFVSIECKAENNKTNASLKRRRQKNKRRGAERLKGGGRGRTCGERQEGPHWKLPLPFLGVCGLPAKSIDYICRQSCLFISHQFSRAA